MKVGYNRKVDTFYSTVDIPIRVSLLGQLFVITRIKWIAEMLNMYCSIGGTNSRRTLTAAVRAISFSLLFDIKSDRVCPESDLSTGRGLLQDIRRSIVR